MRKVPPKIVVTLAVFNIYLDLARLAELLLIRPSMKTLIRYSMVLMLALVAFGCSKKSNNTDPYAYAYGASGLYTMNAQGQCVSRTNGQIVAQQLCYQSGAYGNTYGQYGNTYGQYPYNTGGYGGAYGGVYGGVYGNIGGSLCVGSYYYLGRIVTCYGGNCSGYMLTDMYGRTGMCM
jgi:hypothetical protein